MLQGEPPQGLDQVGIGQRVGRGMRTPCEVGQQLIAPLAEDATCPVETNSEEPPLGTVIAPHLVPVGESTGHRLINGLLSESYVPYCHGEAPTNWRTPLLVKGDELLLRRHRTVFPVDQPGFPSDTLRIHASDVSLVPSSLGIRRRPSDGGSHANNHRWALTDSNRRPLPCKGSALAN